MTAKYDMDGKLRMPDDAQQLAIAELCGQSVPLPDYLNDAKAMARHMPSSLLPAYRRNLRKVMSYDLAEQRIIPEAETVRAEDRQVCEAFLRTLGKWEAA